MARKNKNDKKQTKKMLMLTDGSFDQASARVRAILYIPMFKKSGITVSHIPRVPLKPNSLFSKYFTFPLVKRFLWLKKAFFILSRKWDIIFTQRTFISEWMLSKVKRRTYIIYDFDDALYLQGDQHRNAEKTALMIKYADSIVVSSDYLNKFVMQFNKRATVIPSPIETERIFPQENKIQNEIPVVGWTGSEWTVKYIKTIESALQRLAKEFTFKLLIVGANSSFNISGVNCSIRPWSFEKECDNLNEMDIGIMPLPDDEFTRAKGGYKLYLYMAAGIPCVASPVGINNIIIRHGENGFLAGSEEEWINSLRILLLDSELRKTMGRTGREYAMKYYDRKICFMSIMEIIDGLK
ncbi:MAG: glycosyltransferase [Bacteroidales bacterium]|nr:glycosyltransferase [Bacteroidales bacterium]